MNLTNLLGLPDAFVAAVKNDPYTGGGDISVTKLIDAPQRRVLYSKFKDFVVEDVSDRVWALMGQAVHTVLERAGTSALVEERLFMEVNGWKLSGQFDRLHVADKTIQDWKVTSTYKAEGDDSWTKQLNILRMLAIHNGHDIERLQVVAIFRDWQRSKAERDEKYPQSNVKIIELPVWSNEYAMQYITDRVSMHQSAVKGEEVLCSDDERWYAGTTYALMKEGNKRATKVAEKKEDLGEPAKGFFIEERKGGYRRCEGYCEVAPFCPQLAREREQQEKANA
jgi:hypothetical protein